MRQISTEQITDTLENLCRDANYNLGNDLIASLKNALEKEESPLGKEVITQLLENVEIGRNEQVPVCQDTGFAIVFIEIDHSIFPIVQRCHHKQIFLQDISWILEYPCYTIDNSIALEAVEGIAYLHRYQATIDGLPNPESKVDFAKRLITKGITQHIKDAVIAYRRSNSTDISVIVETDYDGKIT